MVTRILGGTASSPQDWPECHTAAVTEPGIHCPGPLAVAVAGSRSPGCGGSPGRPSPPPRPCDVGRPWPGVRQLRRRNLVLHDVAPCATALGAEPMEQPMHSHVRRQYAHLERFHAALVSRDSEDPQE